MDAGQVLDEYVRWLARQALADRTRSSYRRWVRELVARLAAGGELDSFLAVDGEDDRRAVLGDWRRRLVDRSLAPSTVNLALAAATALLNSRALLAPRVPRVEVDPPPPRALSREQLRAVERETDRLGSSRDRAIMQLLLRTGVADRGGRWPRRWRCTLDAAHRRVGRASWQGRSPSDRAVVAFG